MRYYDIQLISIATNQIVRRWTSHPNGLMNAPDRGALNIEFDVIIYPYAQASGSTGGGDYGQSMVRVWGIPVTDIGQASNWSAPNASAPLYKVMFYGGMGKGLPLANPSQAGLILQGYVWRAIGNWLGLDQTLDLLLSPLPLAMSVSAGNQSVPALTANNFTLNWQAGQPLATAIKSTLQTAFPGVPLQILINPRLILDRAEYGIYATLGEFNDFVNRRSVSILGPGNPQYYGVLIGARNGAIAVYDGTTDTSNVAATGGTSPQAPKTVNIAFTDLVGQPTWIGNGTVQVTVILRADIQQGDFVTLPPSLATVSTKGALDNPAGTFSQAKWSSQFQGTFSVQQVRSVGNYKSPQGTAWVTTLQAITKLGPAVAQSPPPPAPAGNVTIESIDISP
jgi:hypothetical protein